MSIRRKIVTIVISGTLLTSVAVHEGYFDEAQAPVKGDVPTLGFGFTEGVKKGDKIDPVSAIIRLNKELHYKYAAGVKKCVLSDLSQNEFDAYVSLAYNIGVSAFCRSTLVRKLNMKDYAGACAEILRWDKFKGKPLRGLTNRRKKEYKLCMGIA